MNRPGPALAAGLLAAAAALAGCGNPPTGAVAGLLTYAGGPAPITPRTSPPTMPGTIRIRRDGILVRSFATGGRFTVRLVPGRYRISEDRLGCATTVDVRAGETVTATLICSIP